MNVSPLEENPPSEMNMGKLIVDRQICSLTLFITIDT